MGVQENNEPRVLSGGMPSDIGSDERLAIARPRNRKEKVIVKAGRRSPNARPDWCATTDKKTADSSLDENTLVGAKSGQTVEKGVPVSHTVRVELTHIECA